MDKGVHPYKPESGTDNKCERNRLCSTDCWRQESADGGIADRVHPKSGKYVALTTKAGRGDSSSVVNHVPLHFHSSKYFTSKEHASCYFWSWNLLFSCTFLCLCIASLFIVSGVPRGTRISQDEGSLCQRNSLFLWVLAHQLQGWLNTGSVIQCLAIDFKGWSKAAVWISVNSRDWMKVLTVFADSEQAVWCWEQKRKSNM